MKTLSTLLTLLTLTLFVGCASQQVPRSDITWNLLSGTGHLSLPKDADIQGLDISVSSNRVVHVKFDHLVVHTNPEVINSSGAATAQAITATADAVTKAIATGAAIATKAVVP